MAECAEVMAAQPDPDREGDFTPATMTELLAALPEGARVLDFGCGKGSFPYGAFPHLAIDALDTFPPARAQPFPAHVRYRQGEGKALPYAAASFDLAIANFVLEHVRDFPGAIDEIARVLKAGGHFYMAVPNVLSFEDALYRSLYTGGGHIQRHTVESVLATVYGRTALKLVAYIDWPAGFTYLDDYEGLRALAGQVAAACRESLGIEIRLRNNYIFVFQLRQGRGWRQFAAGCGYCGAASVAAPTPGADWTCSACGRLNRAYSGADAGDRRLEADMQALWQRHPYVRPASPPGGITPDDLKRRAKLALRMLRWGRF